jgi:uncharacterized protein YfdQ (DUF2303 family)
MTYDAAAIEAAADLGRRGAEAQRIGIVTDDLAVNDTLLARVIRDDESVEVRDLEHYLAAPRTARGKATLHDPASFAAYVTRLADADETTLWADDKARKIVAVFNDHWNIGTGWRDHTATLAVRVDPDWEAWTAADGKRMAQAGFGEFLEDHLASIIDPPAAVLLELAMTLVAKRSLAFESSARLQSGDVGFAYREETAASAGKKGTLEIPETFLIKVAPFVGSDPVEVLARLRYRISGDGLQLGFKLDRPDLREAEAFAFIVGLVRAGVPTEVPILFGTAPESLR